MSNNKKPSKKKEQERLQELQRQEEQAKRDEERRLKQERLRQLQQKSAPLTDYGLLQAYEQFLLQLSHAGIPQANVYEFAAQSMLKYGRSKQKKEAQLKEVQEANLQAVREVSSPVPKPKHSIRRDIKPQLLPFKGDLPQNPLNYLSKE